MIPDYMHLTLFLMASALDAAPFPPKALDTSGNCEARPRCEEPMAVWKGWWPRMTIPPRQCTAPMVFNVIVTLRPPMPMPHCHMEWNMTAGVKHDPLTCGFFLMQGGCRAITVLVEAS